MGHMDSSQVKQSQQVGCDCDPAQVIPGSDPLPADIDWARRKACQFITA